MRTTFQFVGAVICALLFATLVGATLITVLNVPFDDANIIKVVSGILGIILFCIVMGEDFKTTQRLDEDKYFKEMAEVLSLRRDYEKQQQKLDELNEYIKSVEQTLFAHLYAAEIEAPDYVADADNNTMEYHNTPEPVQYQAMGRTNQSSDWHESAAQIAYNQAIENNPSATMWLSINRGEYPYKRDYCFYDTPAERTRITSILSYAIKNGYAYTFMTNVEKEVREIPV